MTNDKEQRWEDWQKLTPRQRMLAQRKNDLKAIDAPGYNAALVKRAQKRMERVDAMPSYLRALVYEYNLEVVQVFIDHGVKHTSIKYLIDTVLGADFKDGQPRFKLNRGPNAKRNPAAEEDEYWSAT
jgi:hypothetical protein